MRQSDADTPGDGGIRLVSLVEAETVTGPMKPLLMFARNIQSSREGCTAISHSVVTTVRAPGNRPLRTNNFLRAADSAGLPVDVLRERFLFDWSILPQLADRLAAKRPHIVESHDFKSHFLIWLLKRFRRIQGVRWVAFHHGYTRMSAKVLLYQQLDRLSLRAADQVVTVCTPFALQLAQRGVDPGRIRVLANAIEDRVRTSDGDLQRLRKRLRLQPTDRIIVSVGRLSAEKGHATLISAYRKIMENSGSSRLRLVLVGDGGEAQRLRAAAADLGEQIVFTGHVDDPWPYYCLADVFALPSYSEGSPLALFEAMSAALPIVASAVGGIPETLSNGNSALLVPAGSEDELVTALERVLNDADFASHLGSSARATAEQFSPARYTRDRLLIYEKLLVKRPA
jgi:glycosyltransferase involved in cell wall biosynthesis